MERSILCIQQHFPVHSEGSIDTVQFLEASRGLVLLVEQFGGVFGPVKNDLNQNIEKIHRTYQENRDVHRCLLQMVLYEHRRGEMNAVTSLLWLRSQVPNLLQLRNEAACYFINTTMCCVKAPNFFILPILKNISRFFQWGLKLMAQFLVGFVENEKKNVRQEDLSGLLHQAYENSLKPHHNFFVRCLFSALCSQCPTRSNLLNMLGYNHIQDEKLFLTMLDQYLYNLESNLNALSMFCESNNITPHH